jgi:radical SAM superfamily enzyme YgiQ (UPF0313 family)
MSYYLPLTRGCSNNTCAFCDYHGSKLQVRELEEVKREIDALALYLKKGIFLPDMPEIVYALAHRWDGRRVFLQDGDALVYPTPRLREVLRYIGEKLPSVDRVAAYATGQDILRISLADLKDLRELKLGILYMGLESGDDEVLERMCKGIDSAGMIEACRKAKEADMLTSVTVILGLGGEEGSERHALETARVLSEMDPDYAGALTLTIVPGTPLYDEWKQGRFSPISPFQSIQELMTIIERSRFTDCFFSSMHASNYFSVRGTLPRDREWMLGELAAVVQRKDPRLLRPEFLRGL